MCKVSVKFGILGLIFSYMYPTVFDGRSELWISSFVIVLRMFVCRLKFDKRIRLLMKMSPSRHELGMHWP